MHKDISSLFSPWTRFSRKLIDKIERLRSIGGFSLEDAKMRGMRLAVGEYIRKEAGIHIKLYWLVDELDGIIADAKFHAVGPPSLLGAAEIACEFFMRKNYDQVRRIGAELLDKQVRDKKEQEAFPKEEYASLNAILEAAEMASLQCMDIPLSDSYVPTPMQSPMGDGESRPYPNWEELTPKQQVTVIEEVIATDIRPYIELDAGGIEIVSLTGKDLVIAYKGNCTTCYSSIGSTLQAIQQILSAKIHPEIRVIPDSTFLQPPSS
ncbi:MAG: NifU family protein [Rhabdochlamydiaceae bacterium]|nr:NifU family protein [Rhabdochlamydiaceae bacterium]